MSDSTNNKSENNIPEEEEPLGGLYDEEEEKRKLDSAKDFVSDRKDDILDIKDNIDNFKDIIEQMKNREKESSSSSEDSDKSNETTSNDKNSKSEDISSNSTEGLGDKSTTTSNLGNEAGAKTAGAETSGATTTGGATSAGAGTGGAGVTGGAGGVGTAAGGTGAAGGAGTAGVAGGAGSAGAAGAAGAGAGAGTAAGGASAAAGVAAAAPVIPIIIIAIIVIIFIIGIIGFFTVMPGLILGKLKKFGLEVVEGLKGVAIGNYKVVTQSERIEIAQYIQNLGYDIQTYGFADVKYKKKTKKEIEDKDASSTKQITKIVPVNNDRSNDYLSAYITADSQTYLPADTFLFARFVNLYDNAKAIITKDELKSIDQSSSGLINILDHSFQFFSSYDSTNNAENYAYVNTEKRRLYINTKASEFIIPDLGYYFLTNLLFGKTAKVAWRSGDSYSFDLENWTAMYGRPIELFIALHTSTMMPDLSQKIALDSEFNTKVNIELIKGKITYDVEFNTKDGKSIKFSHDTEKYSANEEPIKNTTEFIDSFLRTMIRPDDSSLYNNLLQRLDELSEEEPELKFKFFHEIWKSGKASQSFLDFDGKFDYKKAADNVLKGEAAFEFEDDADTLATMNNTYTTYNVDGIELNSVQYVELAQLLAKGMDKEDFYYPIIKDVTDHWFYGTIDFMGTKGKVSHGAYRRARMIEKRIRYAPEKSKNNKTAKPKELDKSDQKDGTEEDYLDMNSLTKEVVDNYETRSNVLITEAREKMKEAPDNAHLAGGSNAVPTSTDSSDPNSKSVQEKLYYRNQFRKKQLDRAREILANESAEEQTTDDSNNKSIGQDFNIYLNTTMTSDDNGGSVFYQASEPELLGPSDNIKKVFSKSYYQYDGTSETAKKIAAAKSIDKGSDTYYYSGEEYQIQQSDLEEKNEATKARKEGDLENEYYSSPMAKKKVNFTKNNKKVALQALAMLDSMKTHAGDEAYKNIKELLYSLEYFTEEELTTKTKNVLLWIADNGEKTGHENWQTENTKTNSKAERDDNSKYNLVVKNLKQKNMKIVAPGDATASYTSEDGGILTLSFTEMSQDTYDILNYKFNGLKDVKDKSYTGSFTKIDKNILTGYTMKIKGIKDPGKTEFKRGETIVEVENGMTDFGNEDNGKIEISLINEEGSPHDSIEEYMKSDYTKTDEENLKKQMEIEKQSLLRAGYVYTGSASTMTSNTSLATGGNSEGIDFGAGNYTEFNMSNAQEKALNEEQKAFLIYMYLTERGFTPNQAAGIIGNNMQECTLGNLIWGYDDGAMGMFQHTHGEKEALQKFLRDRGKVFETTSLIEDQLDFMLSIYKKNFYTYHASTNMKALGSAGKKNKDYLATISNIINFADQEAIYGKIVSEERGRLVRENGLEESLYKEFQGYAETNTKFYDMFVNAPSPETAATAFCRGYERPESGNAEESDNLGEKNWKGKLILPQAMMQNRRFWARKYFNKFTNQAEIDRIKASLPVQPTTHDSRAFVARTVQGGTVAGDSGSGANTASLANGTEIGLDSNWKYANFSKINSGKAKFYKTTVANKKGKVITVNAGHGTSGGESVETQSHPDGTGKVTGGTNKLGAKTSMAVSSGMDFTNGQSEASVNLKVALKLRDKLLAKGYDVVMIRETADVQLDNIARTVIANNTSDAHIAIHYDGDDASSDKGVFYMKVPNVDSYKKMEPVSRMWQQHDRLGESLVSGLKEKGLKVFGRGTLEMDLTQTSYSTIPSIDIELGNNTTATTDEANDIRAEGLAAGVDKFFNK